MEDSRRALVNRRQAIGLLGAGAGLGLLAAARPAVELLAATGQAAGSSARSVTFPKGAIIRTIFKDLPPEALNGNILFHEHLDGVYSLDGNEFDFHGKVRTEAKVSQMVASRWKSLLLKSVDPFFKGKDGHGGAEIPVKISGTKAEPKFGLDLGKKRKS